MPRRGQGEKYRGEVSWEVANQPQIANDWSYTHLDLCTELSICVHTVYHFLELKTKVYTELCVVECVGSKEEMKKNHKTIFYSYLNFTNIEQSCFHSHLICA